MQECMCARFLYGKKPWQNVLNDGLHAEEEEEEVAFLFRVHHKRGNTS